MVAEFDWSIRLLFSLVSIHVLVGRTTTRGASRCMDDHSLRNKSLRARNKVAHVELLRGLVPRYAVTVIYKNQQRKKKRRFSVLRKKRAKPKTKELTMTFGKSLFQIEYRMRCAIYTPPNTKDLAINQTMVAYGIRQNMTAFAEQITLICCDH